MLKTITVNDLFTAVADHVLQDPDRLDMKSYSNACGSSCCIIGWGCILIPEWVEAMKAHLEIYGREEAISLFADNLYIGTDTRLWSLIYQYDTPDMLNYLENKAWLTDYRLNPSTIIWEANS